MKLIKLNTDHYVVMDDSEIKEGDWFFANQGLRKCIRVDNKTSCPYITLNEKGEEIGHFHTWKGIVTHSTQPLNCNCSNRDYKLDTNCAERNHCFDKIQYLSLQEIKELIGEVDVEKWARNQYSSEPNDYEEIYYLGLIKGYNQALEDNKERKYTEKDILNILYDYDNVDWSKREHKQSVIMMREWLSEKLQSLQPKTEWEVEFNEQGKLQLL